MPGAAPMTRMAQYCLLALGIALFAHAPIRAQCQQDWLPGEGLPGLDAPGRPQCTWDPDGAGPLPECLIVTGNFRVAGDTAAIDIAAWDGQHWHSLGPG